MLLAVVDQNSLHGCTSMCQCYSSVIQCTVIQCVQLYTVTVTVQLNCVCSLNCTELYWTLNCITALYNCTVLQCARLGIIVMYGLPTDGFHDVTEGQCVYMRVVYMQFSYTVQFYSTVVVYSSVHTVQCSTVIQFSIQFRTVSACEEHVASILYSQCTVQSQWVLYTNWTV